MFRCFKILAINSREKQSRERGRLGKDRRESEYNRGKEKKDSV